MNYKILFLGLLLLGLGCVACQSEVNMSEITANQWKLISMPGYAELPVTVTLEFEVDANRAGGTAGCNRYNGAYLLDGDQFGFPGPLMSTMMYCPDPAMDVEFNYLRMVETVSQYKLDDNKLTLFASEGELVFEILENN